MRRLATRWTAFLCAMVLALVAVIGVKPAYAEGQTGTMILSSETIPIGTKVTAYRLFDATVEGTGKDAKTTYALTDPFSNYFITIDELSGLRGDELSAAALSYVNELGEEGDEAVAAFANDVVQHIIGNSAMFDSAKVASEEAGKGDSVGNTVCFENIPYGYYLVFFAGAEDSELGTNAMLCNLVEPESEWNIKVEYPTVDKVVETGDTEANGNIAQVGDTVTFKLKTKVPDLTGFNDNYVFTVTDYMSPGLLYEPSSVTVSIQGTDGFDIITRAESVDIIQPDDEGAPVSTLGGEALQVRLGKFLFANKETYPAGREIVITYKAEVTPEAVIWGSGNPNEAFVTFSNDAACVGTGDSVHDRTHTFTLGFTIVKRAGNVSGALLPGAKFAVLHDPNDAADGSFDEGAFDRLSFTSTDAAYMVADEGEGEDELVTSSTGKLNIGGLKPGVYWIQELEAPSGYAKADPIKVVITASVRSNGESLDSTVTIDGEPVTCSGCNPEVNVVNVQEVELPLTGGAGTTAFVVVGVVAIACGVALRIYAGRKGGAGSRQA